jgi:hypothetical protein
VDAFLAGITAWTIEFTILLMGLQLLKLEEKKVFNRRRRKNK